MRAMCITTAAVTASLAAPAAGGFGALIYDNGEPNGVDGFSNATEGVFGARRTLLDDIPWWDNFTLTGFRFHHIWNSLPPGSGTSYEITLWTDDHGVPGLPFETLNMQDAPRSNPSS